MKNLIYLILSISIINSLHAQESQPSTDDQDRSFFQSARGAFGNAWEELRQEASSAIADAELNIGFDLIDICVVNEAICFSAGPERVIEQSFRQGEYLRIDEYKINNDVNIGTIYDTSADLPGDEERVEIPIGLKLNKDTRFQFIRQFPGQRQAFMARRYSIGNLPLDSERAIEKLVPGDFVSLHTEMNMFLGADLRHTDGVLSYRGQLHYVMRGKFLLHFYRMRDNHIRLKIYAINSRGIESRLQVELGYEYFSLDLANDAINDLLNIDLLKYGRRDTNGNVLVFDYTFNLNNEQAKEAYNNLVKPDYLFNDGRTLLRNFNRRNIDRFLISDLAAVNNLANTNPEAVRKDSEFLTEFDLNESYHGFNLQLIRMRRQATELDANTGLFFTPSFTRQWKFELNLGVIRLSSTYFNSFYSIYMQNPENDDKMLKNIGYIDEDDVLKARKHKLEEVATLLYYNLPDGRFSGIDWKEWCFQEINGEDDPNCELSSQNNVQSYFQFFLNSQGVNFLSEMSYEAIREAIERLSDTPLFRNYILRPWRWRYRLSKDKVARQIFNIFSNESPLSSNGKLRELRDLRRRKRLRKFFPMIIKELLPPAVFNESVYYFFRIFGEEDMQEVMFEIGEDSGTDIYDQVRDINNVLNQDYRRSLRQFEEEDGHDRSLTIEEMLPDTLITNDDDEVLEIQN